MSRELCYVANFVVVQIKHLNVGEILIWLPSAEDEDLVIWRRLPIGNVGQRLHNETSSGRHSWLFNIDHLPTRILVVEIKSFDGIQSLTLSGSELVELIDESLEGVQIPFVTCDV